MTVDLGDTTAMLIRKQEEEIEALRIQLAKLTAHDQSIRTMRRNLIRLGWWHWRRRRRIHEQLAHIALAYADSPSCPIPASVVEAGAKRAV